MTRLKIAPDTLYFYYGYTHVDAVATSNDGYDVDATILHLEGQVEVSPEPVTYRIEPTATGIRFGNATNVATDNSMDVLVRCDAP